MHGIYYESRANSQIHGAVAGSQVDAMDLLRAESGKVSITTPVLGWKSIRELKRSAKQPSRATTVLYFECAKTFPAAGPWHLFCAPRTTLWQSLVSGWSLCLIYSFAPAKFPCFLGAWRSPRSCQQPSRIAFLVLNVACTSGGLGLCFGRVTRTVGPRKLLDLLLRGVLRNSIAFLNLAYKSGDTIGNPLIQFCLSMP
jgi:hypothetical protein